MSPTRPNLLIFVMDTQRVRNMSCYGYHRDTTPNIDRIAAEGVLFEQHLTPATWTVPTHASLFTGRYMSGHGAGERCEFMARDFPTMAEVFGRHGYHTAGICVNGWVSPEGSEVARGFAEWTKVGQAEAVPPYVYDDDPDHRDSGSWKTVGLVHQWVEAHAADANPWLLFINCTEPHDQYWAPEPFRSRFLLEGVTQEQAKAVKSQQMFTTAGLLPVSSTGWDILRSLYDGETATLDHRMGLIFDHLREKGVLDDTILVILSDHGDTQGEHPDHCYHAQTALWDTMLHTPLIIRHPEHFSGGKRVKEVVSTVDLYPALLEAAGIEDAEATAAIQGVSLLPTVHGQRTRELALAELNVPIHVMDRVLKQYPDYDVRKFWKHQRAARTTRWKYVWSADMRDELYDLVADPSEQVNVLDRHPEVAADLRQKLEAELLKIDQVDYGDTRRYSGGPHPSCGREGIERLYAWGLVRRFGDRPLWA